MMTKTTLRTVALASVCLAPLAAAAQDDFDAAAPAAPAAQAAYDNEASIGIRSQSQTSSAFGRYNGAVQHGAFVFGDFALRGREDWKSGNTQYFSLVGKNLDFGADSSERALSPEASIAFKIGNQGTWGVKASYDAISYSQSTTFQTLFDQNGNLTNGAGVRTDLGTAGTVAGNMAYLASKMGVYDVGVRRDIGALSGGYRFNDAWSVNTGMRYEHKSGTMEQSANMGVPTVFLQPIDYDTTRYDATASYTTKRLQTQFGYKVSQFTDNNIQYNLPYVTSGASASAGAVAAYAQAPSNIAHDFFVNAGYNVTPSTRVNGTLSYQLNTQNSAFVGSPETPTLITGTSPTLFASNPGSLNGVVNNYYGRLALTSNPMDRVDFRTSYTVDKRDNQTNNYAKLYGDSGNGTATLATYSGSQQSWTKQTAKIEAGYRVTDSTKATLNYTYQDIQRTNAFDDHSKEHIIGAQVNTDLGHDYAVMLGYDHGARTTHDTLCLVGTYANASYCDIGAAIPYYTEGRAQDNVRLRVDAQPTKSISVGLNGKGTYDTYESLPLGGIGWGLLRDYDVSGGPDLTWSPSKKTNAHVFYEFDEKFTDAMTAAGKGAYGGPPLTNQNTDITHTAGVGGNWQVDDKLKLNTNYVFVYGNTTNYLFDNLAGPCSIVVACSTPKTSSSMHTFKLSGDYEVAPGITWSALYGLDVMKSSDWMYQMGLSAGNSGPALTNVALLNTDPSANYFVHSISTRVKFAW